MKLWLASADLAIIDRLVNSGVFAGVITNPDVVAASKRSPSELFRDIARITGNAPMFYQPPSGPAADMVLDVRRLVDVVSAERMIVKIPATEEGFLAMGMLMKDGLSVAATCLPTVPLAAVAEAIGVRFIIPWGSLLPKRGIGDRDKMIGEIQSILDRQKSATEMVVGAYDASDLVRLAALGVRNVFVWEKDVAAILHQPLADEAAASFSNAWESIQNEQY